MMPPTPASRIRALLLALVFTGGGTLSLLDAAFFHGRGETASAWRGLDAEGGRAAHTPDCPVAWKSASAGALAGVGPVLRVPAPVEHAVARAAPIVIVPAFLASIPKSRAPPFTL
jgi:hypothetical protein